MQMTWTLFLTPGGSSPIALTGAGFTPRACHTRFVTTDGADKGESRGHCGPDTSKQFADYTKVTGGTTGRGVDPANIAILNLCNVHLDSYDTDGLTISYASTFTGNCQLVIFAHD